MEDFRAVKPPAQPKAGDKIGTMNNWSPSEDPREGPHIDHDDDCKCDRCNLE